VVGINAMGLLDTMIHGETALLAGVAQEIRIGDAVLGEESGYAEGYRVVFESARTADYRASVHDIANYLMDLMTDPDRRTRMGMAGRERVVAKFDYRVVGQKFVDIIRRRLGVS
jgi:glycosyltransferase involved in cell wall biosynthesis